MLRLLTRRFSFSGMMHRVLPWLCLGGLALAGCSGPRMLRLSDKTHEPLAADERVDVYVGEIDQQHEKLAVIESDAFAYVDDEVKQRQLEQLRSKARGMGANAVEEVRILPKMVKGYTVDERVPFTAFKQGAYELYFMRGTAIRVTPGEPGSLDEIRPACGWVVENMKPPARLEASMETLPMPALATPSAE